MPDSIVDEQGNSVNAVYGYALFMAKFLKHAQPEKLAFAFDESLESCFRNRIYPDYKSSRGLPDENLAYQLKLCRRLTEALDIPCYSSKRYEADDLIGSLLKQFRSRIEGVVIVSRDKDLGQLLRVNDVLWDFADDTQWNKQAFEERFSVPTELFADYLALVGDPVDDIPGVKGIGAKAATFLINALGGVEEIYQQLETVPSLPIRGASSIHQSLSDNRDLALVSRQLAEIHCGLKPAGSYAELNWNGVNPRKIKSALSRYGIKGRNRQAIENAFEALHVS